MYCPSCGAPNGDGSKFCIKCGKAMPQSTEVGQLSASIPGPASLPLKPKRRAYLWIGLLAVGLIAAGAIFAVVTTGSNQQPTSVATATSAAVAVKPPQSVTSAPTATTQSPTATPDQPATFAPLMSKPTPIPIKVADQPGRIAYTSVACDGKSGFDVYVMNADGSNRTKLNKERFDGTTWSVPPISPDGQKILLVSGDYNNPGDLIVSDVDNTTKDRLARGLKSEDLFTDRWSFDGTQVLYMAVDNQSGEDSCRGLMCNRDIYAVDVNGKSTINLTDNPLPNVSSSWSPDGQRIAFTRVSGDYATKIIAEIFVINTDGTGLTRISRYEQPKSGKTSVDAVPIWSPDGQHIAFLRQTNEDSALFVMNADGSNQTQLPIHDQVTGLQWSWSPDAQWILMSIQYFSGSTSRFKILRLRPDGSDLTRIADGMYPIWSLDGNRITYTDLHVAADNKSFSSDIYVMNADGSGVTQLTNTPECELAGRWIPDNPNQ
jgi:TolB protein